MADTTKKIIAKEGLIFLATFVLGSALIIFYNFIDPRNSKFPYGILPNAIEAYESDLYFANRLLFVGIALTGLYTFYLLTRFIIWAVKTLRNK